MKQIMLAIGLLPGFASQSMADFEAGRDAYIRGDFTLAYQEFMQPATNGDAKSRIGLGLLHARGQGVDRDLVQAHKWFDLAADRRSTTQTVVRTLARENRNYVAKRMSTEQIGEAKIQAAHFSLDSAPGDGLVEIPNSTHGAMDPATAARPSGVTNEPTNGSAVLPSKHTRTIEQTRFAALNPQYAASPSVRIQLAALRDSGKSARAMAEWGRLKRRHRALLGLNPVVSRVDLGNKGVFQRLRAGPFKSLAHARHICRSLRAASQDCLVISD